MDGLCVLLLALLGSAYGQLEGVVRGPGLTAAQREIIVHKHNQYRRTVGASNMMKMTYNMTLEATAQRAADRCIFEHTPTNSVFRDGIDGENIYVTPLPSFDISTPMDVWWNEITNYHFNDRTCDEGKMCGHYTQMAWAYSSSVGCAVALCDSVQGWDTAHHPEGLLLFCQYTPGGNREDMAPFKLGEGCTECYDGSLYCDDGLCSYSPPAVTTPAPVRLHTITGDDVCQARESHDSYMCLSHSYYNNAAPGGDEMCAQISCATSRTAAMCCKTLSSDWLPCGVGKICLDGRCQDDTTGDTDLLKEGCLYGDQKQFLWDHVKHTCASMVKSPKYGRHMCNNDVFRSLCCHTCEHLRTDNPECPWGSAPMCAQFPIAQLICYGDDLTKKTCCETDCSHMNG